MKEYRQKLDNIKSATHDAIMAYHELKKEYEKMEEKLKKYEQQAKTENSEKILTGISHMIGRKIQSIEHTYDYYNGKYLFIVCEDGTRTTMIGS